MKSINELAWYVTEEECRKDPAISYSTLSRFEREGWRKRRGGEREEEKKEKERKKKGRCKVHIFKFQGSSKFKKGISIHR